MNVTTSLMITVCIWGCAWSAQADEAYNGARVVPGEYIVKYKPSAGGAGMVFGKLQGKANMKGAFPALSMYHVSFKTGTESENTLNYEAVKHDPDVEYIEPNYIFSKEEVAMGAPPADIAALATASDIDQASYVQTSDSTGVANSWKIVTPLSTSGTRPIVAIVDTGLDKNHRVFKPYGPKVLGINFGGTGSLWVNSAEVNGTTGVDDDGNGYVDDYNGWNFITNTNNFADDDNHGTHVAGIVVGAGLNIFASNLEESKIIVMPLKFLDSKGSGSTANAVRAIDYAVRNGARIINNSWGGPSYSRALHEVMSYAYNSSVMVVSAAGNYKSDNDAIPMYPANYDVPSNLSVASINSSDNLSSFSNYGAHTVHVGSPGEWIKSTVRGGYYDWMSGTSMAAPFVAGMAALAVREAPDMTGFQIKNLILNESSQIVRLSGKVTTSSRINSVDLITQAKVLVSTASYQPDYSPQYASDRAPASDAGGGAGCGLVSTALLAPGAGGAGGAGTGGVLAGLLMIPLLVWFALRKPAEGKSRRRHDRFKMSTEVRLMIGDRELVGHTNSISQGGLSFNADTALEKGGTVTMRIQSPDGHEVIEVSGQVVWSEANQSYGVQFANAKEGTLAMIQQWTAGLMKT